MSQFTKDELLKIAHLSALKLEDNELELFTEQIKAILAYVDQLQQVQLTPQAAHVRNINIFRDDVVQKSDAEVMLAQAPELDEHYFAVPKILDEK